VDKGVTKFMGETSAKLRQVFELIREEAGVYLFDEFDAIGGERTLENDVGEMRRVLNTFLQFIDQDISDSLIVAASNSPKLLDRALYRRFDDVLYYEPPGADDRKRLIQNILGSFVAPRFGWAAVVAKSEGLSHAELDYACRDSIKQIILSDEKTIKAALLRQLLAERQEARQERKG
jgi:SpoVK/Ycf46/Vps4 family AAA+-type ATPase